EVKGPRQWARAYCPPDESRSLSPPYDFFLLYHCFLQKPRRPVDDEIHQHSADYNEVPVIGIDGRVRQPRSFHLSRETDTENGCRFEKFRDEVTRVQADQ